MFICHSRRDCDLNMDRLRRNPRVILTKLAWMIRRRSSSALVLVPRRRKTPDLVATSVAGTPVVGTQGMTGAFLELILGPLISRTHSQSL